jgi:hypothetical protein
MDNMTITNPQYFNNDNNEHIGIKATIDGITMLVPLDPANRHYAEIMRQVESGIITIADAESTEE